METQFAQLRFHPANAAEELIGFAGKIGQSVKRPRGCTPIEAMIQDGEAAITAILQQLNARSCARRSGSCQAQEHDTVADTTAPRSCAFWCP
jgi:hypothetical protein